MLRMPAWIPPVLTTSLVDLALAAALTQHRAHTVCFEAVKSLYSSQREQRQGCTALGISHSQQVSGRQTPKAGKMACTGCTRRLQHIHAPHIASDDHSLISRFACVAEHE